MNDICLRVEEEFDIVDKAENSAGELGLEIVWLDLHHPRTWQLFDEAPQGRQRTCGVDLQGEGLNLLGWVISLAGDTIRRAGTGGEPTYCHLWAFGKSR